MSKDKEYTTLTLNINQSVQALFDEVRKELEYASLDDLLEDSISFFLDTDSLLRLMGIYYYHILVKGLDEEENQYMPNVKSEAILLWGSRSEPSKTSIALSNTIFRSMSHFLQNSFGVEEVFIVACVLMFRWCMHQYALENIVIAYGDHHIAGMNLHVPLMDTILEYDRNTIEFDTEEDGGGFEAEEGAEHKSEVATKTSDSESPEEVWQEEPLDSEKSN